MRTANLAVAWIVLTFGIVILAKTLATGRATVLSTGVIFGAALVVFGIARILMYTRRSGRG